METKVVLLATILCTCIITCTRAFLPPILRSQPITRKLSCCGTSNNDVSTHQDDTALYQELHRVGGGMFYRGVRGPSRGRGGQFPASSADAIAAFGSLLQPPDSSAHGISGGRLILQNRKDGYEDVFHAEMRTFEAGALEEVSAGLWWSASPLSRQRLGQLASLRSELAPLVGPFATFDAFLEAVRLLPPLPVAGYSLLHIRLDSLQRGAPRSMEMALSICLAMQTKPNGGGAELCVLETSSSIYLTLVTLATPASAVLLTPLKFKTRPFNFAAALDPVLAAVALNILNVGAEDVLLDACCGTGTILVGGCERGARTVGCDRSFTFSSGSRANLDFLGFASVGGGALRARRVNSDAVAVGTNWRRANSDAAAGATNWRCAVACHDARDSFADEFPSLPAPTVVCCNIPHGRYLTLPYAGYLRDIIANVCVSAPGARFCFIGGKGCLEDDGPDNLNRVLDSVGMVRQFSLRCKKMTLNFALGPQNPEALKWSLNRALIEP